MSSTTLPVCPKTGSTSPSLTVPLHCSGKSGMRPQELKRYVLGHMRSLQRTPALLRGFFKKPSLRYITA